MNTMPLNDEINRLLDLFLQMGATRVTPAILQPAKVLLDLYGEDIRSRAYVTHDPLRGEQMLRPDFTVPVVQHHMSVNAEPARYTYAGPVFRHQEQETGRPSEYEQVGYEVFDRSDPIQIEADLFQLFYTALSPLGVKAFIGDIGLLMAAVEGLNISAARKTALKRHIWRPARFRQLLTRFAKPPSPFAPSRGGPHIGLRSAQDIQARIKSLKEDAQTPPLAPSELKIILDLLAIKGPIETALKQLKMLATHYAPLQSATQRLAQRIELIAAKDIALDDILFAPCGLSVMEYYDGFIFNLYAKDHPDWPAIASGGRYDALTRILGRGRFVPAVGGIIRPQLTAQLRGANR